LRYESGITAFFPEKPATPGFLLREVRDRRQAGEGGEIIRTITLVLVPIRLDFLRLPVVDLAWKAKDAGEQRGTVPVDLGRVKVKGKFANPEEATPGAPPEGLSILQRNTALMVGAIALATALAAVLLTLLIIVIARRYLTGRKKELPPADLTALNALDSLEKDTDLRQQPVRFFTRLSEVLRAYLSGRYAFDALEATSTELVAWAETEQPAALSSLKLSLMLESMDTVKFAGRSTQDDEGLEKLGEVRAMVLVTRETPEQRGARVAQLQALIPGKTERMMAFGVDALCGGILSLGLYLAGGLSQNWILIAAGGGIMGLWLLLRDSMGRSPGKAAQDLVLVSAGASPSPQTSSNYTLSTWARVSRNLLLFIWIFLPAEGLASHFLPGGRRLGDLWAGTRVLRQKEGGKEVNTLITIALALAATALMLIPPIWALLQLPGGFR